MFLYISRHIVFYFMILFFQMGSEWFMEKQQVRFWDVVISLEGLEARVVLSHLCTFPLLGYDDSLGVQNYSCPSKLPKDRCSVTAPPLFSPYTCLL